MHTEMQQTSLEVFYHTQRTLGKRENELLEALKQIQPACDRDLAKYLDWEIGQVNGRRNELVSKGKIKEDYRDQNPLTKRKVIYWRIT